MSLRAALVKLAHENPELRKDLLPLLQKQAHGPVALKDPDVMLYYIEPRVNSSKFYEMKIVRSAGGFMLQKRWGRLSDTGSPSRQGLDSKDEMYATSSEAMSAMNAHARAKRAKGYVDAKNKEYPIGLGAAGFGWAGQAACPYVPELGLLQQRTETILSDLDAFAPILAQLKRKGSTMAPKLESLISEIQGATGNLNRYLTDQLGSCKRR